MGGLLCSQHHSGIDDLHEKQRLGLQQAKLLKLNAQMSSPRTTQQLKSKKETQILLIIIGALYGMGDFMSGSSDSSADPIIFKIGNKKENYY